MSNLTINKVIFMSSKSFIKMKKVYFLTVFGSLFFGSFYSQADWRERDRLIEHIKSTYNISIDYFAGKLSSDEMVEFLEAFIEQAKQLDLPKSPLPITVMVFEENYDWPWSKLPTVFISDIQFVNFQLIHTGDESAAAAVDMIKGLLDFRSQNKEDLELISKLAIDVSYNLEYSPWSRWISDSSPSYYYNFIKNLAQELRERQISSEAEPLALGLIGKDREIETNHGNFKSLESLMEYFVEERYWSRRKVLRAIEESPEIQEQIRQVQEVQQIQQQIANFRVRLDVLPEDHFSFEASTMLGPDLLAIEGERTLQVGAESHSAAIDWLVETYDFFVEGVPPPNQAD